jgi:hypothetical protein
MLACFLKEGGMSHILYEGEHLKVKGYQHPDLNCSRVKIIGHLAGDELLNEALPKINDFFEASIGKNLKNRIIDFSEFILGTNFKQIELLANKNQYFYEKHPDAKVVIIAGKDLIFGEMRIYDALCIKNSDNIRTIVRTFTEAQEWLKTQ